MLFPALPLMLFPALLLSAELSFEDLGSGDSDDRQRQRDDESPLRAWGRGTGRFPSPRLAYDRSGQRRDPAPSFWVSEQWRSCLEDGQFMDLDLGWFHQVRNICQTKLFDVSLRCCFALGAGGPLGKAFR